MRKLDLNNVIREFAERLSKKIRIRRIIVFGSTARGTRLKSSDVDLIIISDDFKDMPLNERFRIVYMEWPPEIDADIIPLTHKEFEEALSRSIILKDAQKYWYEIQLQN